MMSFLNWIQAKEIAPACRSIERTIRVLWIAAIMTSAFSSAALLAATRKTAGNQEKALNMSIAFNVSFFLLSTTMKLWAHLKQHWHTTSRRVSADANATSRTTIDNNGFFVGSSLEKNREIMVTIIRNLMGAFCYYLTNAQRKQHTLPKVSSTSCNLEIACILMLAIHFLQHTLSTMLAPNIKGRRSVSNQQMGYMPPPIIQVEISSQPTVMQPQR